MGDDLDPSEDPENIKLYGLQGFMYSTQPDLVFCEQTGWSAAMPGLASSLIDDPVPTEPDPDAGWREEFRAWWDAQP